MYFFLCGKHTNKKYIYLVKPKVSHTRENMYLFNYSTFKIVLIRYGSVGFYLPRKHTKKLEKPISHTLKKIIYTYLW